ncbi:MAG TPA: DUF460 domain-containing protein [Methanothermobacter sp.]|uniref:DUF460 domain-containing protein n=1 Tax=Methanothermobacter tenebrarum TaxID=680118 RepID=A0ABN6PEL9_9EURY|nr:DUF460 domain-containing protein [Methanothermobacter tenebrarum]MDD3454873.1 DUF460 domain-containing protein [Methanobacteriales archaeon]MDI6881843.1 DUF460 domain-containing protein [Methanothermobacter sp.]MDX9692647.1 DUF460 domain-containing protein [Methanothermobacter sp.]BDH79158.1 hypothetical protein MTTB_05370 [Methanothermobacter tenebrarum]HHW17219.1 DUF460 domain-containing protein [Methanothermobacter sp.]
MEDDKLKTNSVKSPIIVGLDPGLTVGIAILDLRGNLVHINSIKEASHAEVIMEIMDKGKAIVIGSDVHPPPRMVKKIATALNSRLYTPERIFPVALKNELVNTFLIEKRLDISLDAHERDALAAAIKTYRHYENKLRQAESRLTNSDISQREIDEIKGLVIKGTPITNAIKKIRKPKGAEKIIEKPHREKPKEVLEEFSQLKTRVKVQKRKIEHQKLLINRLKRQNRILKNKLRRQKRENLKLKKKIERLHYEYSKDILLNRELSSKIKLIKKLQEKYNKEKNLRENLEKNINSLLEMKEFEHKGEKLPVKIVKSFTKEGIKEACQQWKIKKDDLILLYNAKGGGSQTAKILTKIAPRAIITRENMSHQALGIFEDKEIPVISAKDISLEIREDFALVKAKDLEKEIGKWKKKIMEKRIKKEKQKLWKIIDEYRAKRRRTH